MAAKLPTIFTDCSGAPPYYVDETQGFMARTDDVASLRHHLYRMISMTDDDRNTMGERAAQLIRDHYSIEDVSKRFIEFVSGTWG
jgi:glycosyltransferase involved in cell wall biosynthesis